MSDAVADDLHRPAEYARTGTRIHDLAITRHGVVGSPGFFADLDEYHFEKLHHLRRLVEFDGPEGRRVLDIGCGTGVDLVYFARGGAAAIGIDASEAAIRLAAGKLGHQRVAAHLVVGDGEALPFADTTFDYVFAHGVVQYTADDRRLVEKCRRVLKSAGKAFGQADNRVVAERALARDARRSRARRCPRAADVHACQLPAAARRVLGRGRAHGAVPV